MGKNITLSGKYRSKEDDLEGYKELCGIQRKSPRTNSTPARPAGLVFADTKANVKKTKRAVFCQRSERYKKKKLKYEF